MKLKINNKIFTVLCAFCFDAMLINAQGCDPIGISTDPSNPINAQKSSAANHFDWMLSPSSFDFTCYPGPLGTPYTIVSPFYENDPNLNYNKIANGSYSDFYPQDGWELFKYNLGRLDDNSTLRQTPVVVPYIMLYNKYTGIMRVFASLSDPAYSDYQTVIVHLYEALPDVNKGINPGLNASAFFSRNGKLEQPLDQKTTVTDIQIPTQFGNVSSQFFYADFKVAYDPCVCHYPSTIDADFTFISSGTVDLTGTAVLKTVSTGGSDKVQTEITDGVAALVGLATSIATGSFGFTAIPAVAKFLTDAGAINSTQAKNINFASNLAKQGVTLYSAVEKLDGWPNGDSASKFLKAVGTNTSSSAMSTSTAVTAGSTSGSAQSGSISLTGSVSTEIDYGNSDFTFSTPGSQNSEWNDEEWNGTGGPNGNGKDNFGNKLPEYPAYNEILGTMALLTKPVVERFDSGYTTGCGYGCVENNIKTVYRIISDPVYAFNPIMHIDPNKTQIKVALWLRKTGTYPLFVNNSINFNVVGTTLDFITPFVDVNCSQNLMAEIAYFTGTNSEHDMTFNQNYELDIKFLVYFVSTDIGRNGEPNNSVLVFSYPVTVNNITNGDASNDPLNTPPAYFGDLASIPDNLTISTTQNYTTNMAVRANQTISIDAPLVAWAGAKPILLAGKSISISPGVIVEPGITLEIGDIDDLLCSGSVPPQTHDYVNSYCDGAVSGLTYNAYQTESKQEIPLPPNSISALNGFNCTIYPNPAKNTATLRLELPYNEEMSMDITDIAGKTVRTVFVGKAFTAGPAQLQFDITGLQSGVYFFKIYNGTVSQVKKLVIMDK